jgi:regulator of replication initiation timing
MELELDTISESLGSLEQRVVKAVELVSTLRDENASLRKELAAAEAEKERAVKEARGEAMRVGQELDQLRSERKQVRTRIEKLLGQMDLLSDNS